MKKAVAALCVALLLAGCGQVHRVDITAGSNAFDEINVKAAGRIVTIDLAGGERRQVAGFRIEGTTAEWRDSREPGGIATVPISGLEAVRIRGTGRRVGQTLAGAGIGLTGGVLVGSILAADVPESDSHEPLDDLEQPLQQGVIILSSALLGGLVGAIVGAAIEVEEVFEFTDEVGSSVGVGQADKDHQDH